MTIKNMKTTYEVEATSGELRLSGSISTRESEIIDASLNVRNDDGTKYANYYVGYDQNASINGTDEFINEALIFIHTEIASFKTLIA